MYQNSTIVRAKFIKTLLKWLLRLLLIVLTILLLALIALYIPAVQDFAVKKVLTSVNSNPDQHITVERFRLYPPLHIEADGITMEQKGDTLAHVDNIELRVALLHIFKGCVGIDELTLAGVQFNMGAPDSAMYLRSSISSARLADADIALTSKTVDVDLLKVSGTLFSLDMKPDGTEKPDTATAGDPLPWKINLEQLRIDSLTYNMTMLPTIDTLSATIPAALIEKTSVDLSGQAVDVESFLVDNLTARYLTPPATESTPTDKATEEPADTTASMPWTINVGHIDIKADSALYGVTGAVPVTGLDMNYLQVSKVNIIVDSLLSRGTELRVPIKRIAAHERCGLDLTLYGLFAMNADSLTASDMHLSTLHSALTLDAMMGMKGSGLPMPLTVNGKGYLSPVDAATALPSLAPMMAGIPETSLLDLNIDIAGQNGVYDIKSLSLEMPRCFDISARGSIAGLPDMDSMDGRVILSGHIANGRWVKPALAAAKLDKTVNVPPLNLNGVMNMRRGTVSGNLAATTSGGKLALDADWTARAEVYDLQLKADDFPIDAFMPLLGVERVTAVADVKGRGYDPFKASTHLDADVKINSIVYNKHEYTDIDLSAKIAEGNADITATSGNSAAAFDLRANGNLATTPYEWTMAADVTNIDLKAMGMTDSVMDGSVSLNGKATVMPGKDGSISANVNVDRLDWHMPAGNLATTDIRLHFLSNDSTTSATVKNHDLNIAFNSPQPLDSITGSMPRITAAIDSIMARHRVEVDMLQKSLPEFTLDLTAGQDNIVSNFLDAKNMGFTSLNMAASNDSLIDMKARVMSFNSGTTVVDTITAAVYQLGDTLNYRFHIGNRPGTLDQWAMVTARGRASDNRASILFNQQNIDGKTGYRLGFIARWMPDEIKVRVVPSHPIIGYKNWTVNDSNFVSLNTAMKHFDADLAMSSAESSIHLYTDHNHRTDSLQEDLILNVKDIKLAEWIALNPFAPPVSGDLSADMRFGWGDKAVNGDGTISLTDLNYDKQRVGTFDLGVALQTNKSGTVRANATLMVDSIKTITAEGNLNDSTARNPFLLDFKMIHFPLNVLNPFLPKDMARFAGTLNGTMDITGSLSEPVFNGYLDFDSTTLRVPMFGTTYTFSDEKIPMDSNIVSFNNFTIKGANANPLAINGTVDARHLSDILIDLNARARDMQVVGSKKGRGIQVYGKAFIDLDANVKGTLSRLDIDATLSVLENTNVTYIVESATDNLTSRSNADMVKFVNFADTTVVALADSVPPSSMMMSIDAILNVHQGSTIGVDLSTDGKNRVQLLSQGSLNYNMSYMGDSRLTGRLNLNGGYVRYTPPFMSEKLFDFQEGSYISFNGNMMNPYLNIKAIDVLRANVQQDGQNSRLINFDVILSVTNSLDNMNVAFDLATNDDITVANELQSMSAEQRANQAMNLLLYNVYTGPGTKASSSLNGNPLFSFLESQVNSWAANNIKGVDLSFGIDQYDRTVNGASSTTTSYSYKVSKSLFNDRFKISIGGNYASDADRDQNLSQNLINDISFEYNITPSGSMYIKIFRHTGYESILEGEVTQTGVGFVYKRKLRRLSDLFKPFYRRPKTVVVPADDKKSDAQTNDSSK